jgi:hypothetical protein
VLSCYAKPQGNYTLSPAELQEFNVRTIRRWIQKLNLQGDLIAHHVVSSSGDKVWLERTKTPYIPPASFETEPSRKLVKKTELFFENYGAPWAGKGIEVRTRADELWQQHFNSQANNDSVAPERSMIARLNKPKNRLVADY